MSEEGRWRRVRLWARRGISLKTRFWQDRVIQPAIPEASLSCNIPGHVQGTPIDRYYIDRFLAEHRQDIVGRILEVRDSEYARKFGAAVTECDVLDRDPSNRNATLIADLSVINSLRPMAFDCFILAHQLQLIYNQWAAVENAWRLLRPGGVILATVPAIGKVDAEGGGDYWRYTAASCSRLFAEWFGPENTTVKGFGNLLACSSFLSGLASEELPPKELAANDDAFPVIIGVRAVKRSARA